MKQFDLYHIELRHYDGYDGGGCRVYESEELVKGATAGGCGYDRGGKALGNWCMTKPVFAEGIKHLTTHYGSGDKHKGGYYGLRYWNSTTEQSQHRFSSHCKAYVDGACGIECIKRLIKAVGGQIEWGGGTKSSDFYLIRLPHKGDICQII